MVLSLNPYPVLFNVLDCKEERSIKYVQQFVNKVNSLHRQVEKNDWSVKCMYKTYKNAEQNENQGQVKKLENSEDASRN
jgi:hypothetical protein